MVQVADAVERVCGFLGIGRSGRAVTDASLDGLVLYVSTGCMFCVRVQAAIGWLGLSIERRNTLFNRQALLELVEGGGSGMVPCLRISDGDNIRWMYESADIIRYLKTIETIYGSEQ